ncbi:Predicted lipoprotein with conserved Yx(FWY)xxD motif [Micromonospora pattaloongensis]|uniref:Predicted lipoprotein with conserved Yx(FWY)xxD motif n=1 Tax=Micromonospora pattaloongensis TaxID=405436 RepID=A0A1H3K0X3_9ACTN|nr:hypothetical protein [Micromonospora pattaloongensis]SDY45870.1 Predicted lipoprotein with conserved Yx(FWY)xxD motif [Micromonospora pattaloongensis]
MALVKRTVILAGTLAAMTLAGCAPAGYSPDEAGAEAQPVANAAAEASPSASAAPEAAEAAADVDLTTRLVGKSVPQMGKVVTDDEGWTLYRFDKDTDDPPTSNCSGDCAKVWPPALTDGSPEIAGISPDKVGTVNRPDGTKQLTIGGWPVYRYAGDTKPGQWKGQGVGATWFVVAPDGKKNLECLPTGTPKAVPPPAEGDSAGSSSGGYNY